MSVKLTAQSLINNSELLNYCEQRTVVIQVAEDSVTQSSRTSDVADTAVP